MITKEAVQQAYQVGVQKALHDAGLTKSSGIGAEIPIELALGAGIGGVGGGISDNSTAGVGALRGLSATGGAQVGGLAADKLIGALFHSPGMTEASIKHPLLGGGAAILGGFGGLGLGGYGGYKLMKELGPNPRQTLAQKLNLSQ